MRLTITERHCMPNHSLPSHLLDWLWIGLSTGPNGAAAEMISSSIAASAYWRGWTLKAWRYFLSRLLQGVRKGSLSDRHKQIECRPSARPTRYALFSLRHRQTVSDKNRH